MASSQQGLEINGGNLQDFTIDQLAGATALILGSIGGLLMIIWKSRCACRMRIGCSDKCYIFDCAREPPQGDNGSSDEEQPSKKEKENINNTNDEIDNKTPVRNTSFPVEPEPEPEVARP